MEERTRSFDREGELVKATLGRRARDRFEATRASLKRWLGPRPPPLFPPIAILSFNRPEYLAPTLDSLAAQTGGLAAREVHVFQDGAVNAYSGVRYATDEEIAACVAIAKAKLPGSVIHLSRHNIGVCENFLRAEQYLFERRRAEVAYFFEDDMVLSPYYLMALDLLEEALRGEPRIGYFAAYGDHHSGLPEQRARQRALIKMQHHWAYGLKRSVWRAMQPVLAPYYNLVVGNDYRQRNHAAIYAAQRRFGFAHPASSQDAAKAISTAVLGTWRARTVPCYGRYIGVRGTHFTPAIYERLRFAETVMFPDPPTGFDPPTPAELDDLIEASRAILRRDFEKSPPGR